MNKLLIICLCAGLFVACKKSDGDAVQVKAQAGIDDKLIADYISANGINATKVMVGRLDTTGVWYVVSNPGSGNTLITSSSLLTVGYTGRILKTGKVFTQTDAFHPSYSLGNMIKGWQLGLTAAKIKKGAKVRLLIASRYAYGPYDQPTLGIPGNSVLDFDIELFDVTN